jgi:cell division protein FtsN
MKNESVMIERRQIFLLFFSSIVIMILVFGVGVLLGKKLSAVAVSAEGEVKISDEVERREKKLSSVIDSGIADSSEMAEKASVEQGLNQKLASVVSDTKKDAEKKDTEVAKGQEVEKEKAKTEVNPPEKAKEKPKERRTGEERVAKGKGETENKKPEIVDAKFTIQVGAFPDKSQALKISAELEKKGYDSWIQRAKSKDREIYRVRIGKFATKQDAEKFKQQFDKKEKYNSFITPLE